MTGGALLVAALLLVAAALVAWPVQTIRSRRRRVLTPGRGSAGPGPDDALVEWIRELGRTLDGPVDETGESLTSGRPVGMAYQPQPGAGSGARRTALGWPARDITGRPSWPGAPGGSMGSKGPAGPTRPPIRRDPRRPAGTALPEVTTTDAERGGGTSVAAIAIDGIGVAADRWGDAPGATSTADRTKLKADSRVDVFGAEGCGDVDSRDHGDPAEVTAADLADMTAVGPSAGAVAPAVRPRARVLPLVSLLGGGIGAVVGGPVAAVALASYGTLSVRGVLRWRANRRTERIRRRGLDQLCGLAADLRAGLPVPHTLETAGGPGQSDRLRQLTSAAVRLADRTGAPLAELVERIEADARATDRGLAAAAAQAAGARATAWLLAALPIGGITLGYGIGVDPVAMLLHSRVGGACAVLAVALQVVGLLWAERLGAAPGRAG
ncbi:type II secretion system F family protein [Micromonospora zamorensis]|uniref:type II secretion system F family protein n=1 Tax=Micromonospora zamorensis TaxID=709883 RepID=UPI00371E781D